MAVGGWSAGGLRRAAGHRVPRRAPALQPVGRRSRGRSRSSVCDHLSRGARRPSPRPGGPPPPPPLPPDPRSVASARSNAATNAPSRSATSSRPASSGSSPASGSSGPAAPPSVARAATCLGGRRSYLAKRSEMPCGAAVSDVSGRAERDLGATARRGALVSVRRAMLRGKRRRRGDPDGRAALAGCVVRREGGCESGRGRGGTPGPGAGTPPAQGSPSWPAGSRARRSPRCSPGRIAPSAPGCSWTWFVHARTVTRSEGLGARRERRAGRRRSHRVSGMSLTTRLAPPGEAGCWSTDSLDNRQGREVAHDRVAPRSGTTDRSPAGLTAPSFGGSPNASNRSASSPARTVPPRWSP